MLNVVAIGGGTGLSILLRGIKDISPNITAVVTVADDGGGSGVLREDLGMLPPGDVRNCILALANQEPILQDLFQYRFTEGRLKGQNFGNLMIAAMVGISDSFETAVQKIADIFAITGEVFPVSEEDLVLYAKLSDGSTVVGESNIPLEAIKKEASIEKIWIEPEDARTIQTIVNRIHDADMIVLGPGSLFTSIIPNLLVKEVVEAINDSEANIYYISNIMTQPGESDGMSAGDHLMAIYKHTRLKNIDFIIANNGLIESNIVDRYAKESSSPVLLTQEDREWLKAQKIQIIEDNFVEVVKGYVRHDTHKIGESMLEYVVKEYKIN